MNWRFPISWSILICPCDKKIRINNLTNNNDRNVMSCPLFCLVVLKLFQKKKERRKFSTWTFFVFIDQLRQTLIIYHIFSIKETTFFVPLTRISDGPSEKWWRWLEENFKARQNIKVTAGFNLYPWSISTIQLVHNWIFYSKNKSAVCLLLLFDSIDIHFDDIED